MPLNRIKYFELMPSAITINRELRGIEWMINKILYGIAAIAMIVAIAYGGSLLYQFLVELLKKTI